VVLVDKTAVALQPVWSGVSNLTQGVIQLTLVLGSSPKSPGVTPERWSGHFLRNRKRTLLEYATAAKIRIRTIDFASKTSGRKRDPLGVAWVQPFFVRMGSDKQRSSFATFAWQSLFVASQTLARSCRVAVRYVVGPDAQTSLDSSAPLFPGSHLPGGLR
jgi:hypothetical protein